MAELARPTAAPLFHATDRRVANPFRGRGKRHHRAVMIRVHLAIQYDDAGNRTDRIDNGVHFG